MIPRIATNLKNQTSLVSAEFWGEIQRRYQTSLSNVVIERRYRTSLSNVVIVVSKVMVQSSPSVKATLYEVALKEIVQSF